MYGLYQIVYFTIIDIWRILMSPFFIVICIIIMLQYNRLNKSPMNSTIASIILGTFGGIIATVSFIYLEVVINPKDFIYIYIIAVLLSFIDLRFVCISYGGSIITLSSLLFGYPAIEGNGIMVVIGVLHIIESILILLNGSNQKEAAIFQQNGELVGGFNMNRFWPIPFVVFIGGELIYPISLIAILVYGDYSITTYPRKKAIETSILLFLYSSILLFFTKNLTNQIIAPLFALLGHELIIFTNKYMEEKGKGIFNNPLKGVRVLDVKTNGIAYKLGIRTGDIILSINQLDINGEIDIMDILSLESKSIDIKFFSLRKGIISKSYRGKNKTLGLVIVPKVLKDLI